MVELAVTVAVAAIIVAMAVPSFSNLIRSNRLTSSANELLATLQTARLAAVSQRARVEVCPSADGATCTAAIGNRWIAIMTKSGATSVLRDSTLHAAVLVKVSRNVAAGSNTFRFTPDGFSATGSNPSGTIGLCVADLPGNNGIDLSASVGRVSTQKRAATTACTAPQDN